MKTRLAIGIVMLSLLVTLANYTTSAQVNKSIVDTTKVWHDGGIGCGMCTIVYKFGADTLVNDKKYSKLYYSYNSDYDFKYTGIIVREDSNRVYFRNFNDTTELKLYDFNLNVGDTITTAGIGPCSLGIYYDYFYTIIDVDTIIIENTPLKRLIINDAEFDLNVPFEWIEGIGSNFGLFSRFCCWDGMSPELFCCSQDGKIIYQSKTAQKRNACYIEMGIDDVVTFDINIYPNPTTSNINIDIGGSPVSFALYDLSGRMFMQKYLTTNYTLDLSSLSPNIYNIIFFTKHGITNKTIIKQ